MCVPGVPGVQISPVDSLQFGVVAWSRAHLFFLMVEVILYGAAFGTLDGFSEGLGLIGLCSLLSFCLDVAGICLVTDAVSSQTEVALKSMYTSRNIFIASAILRTGSLATDISLGPIFLFYLYYYGAAGSIILILLGVLQFVLMITGSRLSVLLGKLRAIKRGKRTGTCCGPPICDAECGESYPSCCSKSCPENEGPCGDGEIAGNGSNVSVVASTNQVEKNVEANQMQAQYPMQIASGEYPGIPMAAKVDGP